RPPAPRARPRSRARSARARGRPWAPSVAIRVAPPWSMIRAMATPADRIDAPRAALIAYDVCRRALTPSDAARRAAMKPVLEAWVTLIAACRARAMPISYTTPVSRADGADVALLPTDLSTQPGVPSLTNCVEGTPEAGFPDEIAPRPEDYVFL